jgi:molybdopterin synthase catalytic subunit
MGRSHKNIFIEGAIAPSFIADSIAAHQKKMEIGAHEIFLGQVRADAVNGKVVAAIEYTAHKEMALDMIHQIREAVFARYDITCLHIYHGLGRIGAGDLCLFVFVSAPHRKAAMDACRDLVERIKKELPVWGKEIFEDESHQWKINQ